MSLYYDLVTLSSIFHDILSTYYLQYEYKRGYWKSVALGEVNILSILNLALTMTFWGDPVTFMIPSLIFIYY